MRTLLVLAVALTIGGCATETDRPPTDTVTISVADFMIEPDDVTATGPTIAFDVINDGPTPHNFTIRNEAGETVAATTDLSVGEAELLEVELKPGTYTIFCSLAGHESLGMSGTLAVTGR